MTTDATDRALSVDPVLPRDDVVALFDEALEDASILADLDPAAIEAWVSGLLATWRAEWPEADPLVADRALLARCDDDSSVGALLICQAVSSLIPEVEDDALAASVRIRRGLETDNPADVVPSSADVIGTAVAESAWRVSFSDSPAGAIVMGFIHADSSEHSLLADLDEDGRLVDLRLAGSTSTLLPTEDDLASNGPAVEVSSLDPAAAAGAIAEAWQVALDQPVAGPSDDLVLNQLLAAARLRAAGGGPVPGFLLGGDDEANLRPPDDDVVDDGDGLSAGERAEANAASLRTLQYALRQYRDQLSPAPEELSDDLVQTVQGSILGRGSPLLEWADWLGVVIGLVRAGAGSDATPRRLVDHINRCPEVASTIPKSERREVEDAFDTVIDAWTEIGVIDDGQLTPVGHWVLPRAAARAWGGDF